MARRNARAAFAAHQAQSRSVVRRCVLSSTFVVGPLVTASSLDGTTLKKQQDTILVDSETSTRLATEPATPSAIADADDAGYVSIAQENAVGGAKNLELIQASSSLNKASASAVASSASAASSSTKAGASALTSSKSAAEMSSEATSKEGQVPPGAMPGMNSNNVGAYTGGMGGVNPNMAAAAAAVASGGVPPAWAQGMGMPAQQLAAAQQFAPMGNMGGSYSPAGIFQPPPSMVPPGTGAAAAGNQALVPQPRGLPPLPSGKVRPKLGADDETMVATLARPDMDPSGGMMYLAAVNGAGPFSNPEKVQKAALKNEEMLKKWKEGDSGVSDAWESAGSTAISEVTKTLKKIEKARSGADTALLRLKKAVSGMMDCDIPGDADDKANATANAAAAPSLGQSTPVIYSPANQASVNGLNSATSALNSLLGGGGGGGGGSGMGMGGGGMGSGGGGSSMGSGGGNDWGMYPTLPSGGGPTLSETGRRELTAAEMANGFGSSSSSTSSSSSSSGSASSSTKACSYQKEEAGYCRNEHGSDRVEDYAAEEKWQTTTGSLSPDFAKCSFSETVGECKRLCDRTHGCRALDHSIVSSVCCLYKTHRVLGNKSVDNKVSCMRKADAGCLIGEAANRHASAGTPAVAHAASSGTKMKLMGSGLLTGVSEVPHDMHGGISLAQNGASVVPTTLFQQQLQQHQQSPLTPFSGFFPQQNLAAMSSRQPFVPNRAPNIATFTAGLSGNANAHSRTPVTGAMTPNSSGPLGPFASSYNTMAARGPGFSPAMPYGMPVTPPGMPGQPMNPFAAQQAYAQQQASWLQPLNTAPLVNAIHDMQDHIRKQQEMMAAVKTANTQSQAQLTSLMSQLVTGSALSPNNPHGAASAEFLASTPPTVSTRASSTSSFSSIAGLEGSSLDGLQEVQLAPTSSPIYYNSHAVPDAAQLSAMKHGLEDFAGQPRQPLANLQHHAAGSLLGGGLALAESRRVFSDAAEDGAQQTTSSTNGGASAKGSSAAAADAHQAKVPQDMQLGMADLGALPSFGATVSGLRSSMTSPEASAAASEALQKAANEIGASSASSEEILASLEREKHRFEHDVELSWKQHEVQKKQIEAASEKAKDTIARLAEKLRSQSEQTEMLDAQQRLEEKTLAALGKKMGGTPHVDFLGIENRRKEIDKQWEALQKLQDQSSSAKKNKDFLSKFGENAAVDEEDTAPSSSISTLSAAGTSLQDNSDHGKDNHSSSSRANASSAGRTPQKVKGQHAEESVEKSRGLSVALAETSSRHAIRGDHGSKHYKLSSVTQHQDRGLSSEQNLPAVPVERTTEVMDESGNKHHAGHMATSMSCDPSRVVPKSKCLRLHGMKIGSYKVHVLQQRVVLADAPTGCAWYNPNAAPAAGGGSTNHQDAHEQPASSSKVPVIVYFNEHPTGAQERRADGGPVCLNQEALDAPAASSGHSSV
ncbi:unnamed protein product [Amoebophrya sp. A25]|nr:unnamed protein product [Amoebophrya sp. A25]|eukprot:GSA25T00007603001.1